MLRALGLTREPEVTSTEDRAKYILKQVNDFEYALKAMDFVLDDRSNQGIEMLEGRPETVSRLALGVIQFIEATLGFEHDMMKRASETLSDAESASNESKNLNIRLGLKTSSIYPIGTEYLVTLAESTLLNALLMLLQENGMVENAKALFKLRKAYQTLDEINKLIIQQENRKQSTVPGLYSVKNTSSISVLTTSSNQSVQTFVDLPLNLSEQQTKDEKIINNLENIYKMRNSRINGSHIGNTPINESLKKKLIDSDVDIETDEEIRENLAQETSTTDEFIHSGVNLCFGILQVVLSLIPPAIGKVLSVVGFKGSREVGLKMLWKATKTRNIHSELALLALLVFYDGPFQFTDVDFDIPSTNSDSLNKQTNESSLNSNGKSMSKSKRKVSMEKQACQGLGEPTLLYPGRKLEEILLRARATFPNSALWLLQEGRMLASRGKLDDAVKLMDSHKKEIEMRQVEGLLLFDKGTMLIFLHRYEEAATSFLKLIQVNSWSDGLYTYFAGCCYLEIYRMIKAGERKDIENLGKYKKLAEEYITKSEKFVPKKKGFMSKPMPFDRFLMRKVGVAKRVSLETGLSIVDCFGTSPIHELKYFWNGYNRMQEKDLRLSLTLLGYSGNKDDSYVTSDENGNSFAMIRETREESMIRYLLTSLILRRLGETEKGMGLLDTRVLNHIIIDQSSASFKFHKLTYSPYLYPTALYEKSLFIWKVKNLSGLGESREWLKKAEMVGDGDYELSARTGMKIKAAIDRLEGL